MAIVLIPSSNANVITAQTILDAVARDLRQVLNSTDAPSQIILLDYLNRVHLYLLRISRWTFLQGPVQHFITEYGQTDYFITSGTAPSGTVDTGLGLSDLDIIKEGSVFDRSNFRELFRTSAAPLLSRVSYQDDQSRPGRPSVWRNDPNTPNILNIYPAPDNQNTYQPVPTTPYITSFVGGALPKRSYYAKTTFVDSNGGESSASLTEAFEFIPAHSFAKVHSPEDTVLAGASGINYNKWNLYLGTSPGQEVLQNPTPLLIGTDWNEQTMGPVVSGGLAAPINSSLEPMRGYLIEFSYYKIRQQISAITQTLQVPDRYKDILVAGVNSLAFLYLQRQDESNVWQQQFQLGVKHMIADKNLFPKGSSYISPDPASITRQLPSIESLDLSRFMLP